VLVGEPKHLALVGQPAYQLAWRPGEEILRPQLVRVLGHEHRRRVGGGEQQRGADAAAEIIEEAQCICYTRALAVPRMGAPDVARRQARRRGVRVNRVHLHA
jgi:hypothetical protein